jgi:hypothetical protein
VAAFTVRRGLKTYLRRRLDTFINSLVYTFWDNQGMPSIMTMSARWPSSGRARWVGLHAP